MPAGAGTPYNSSSTSADALANDAVSQISECAYLADDGSPVTHAQLDDQFWSDWIADVARVRNQLRRHGYVPVAVASWNAAHLPPKSRGKAPVVAGWQRRTLEDELELPSIGALNTGILCAALRVIDIDVPDRDRAERIVELAIGMFGRTILRWRRNTGKTLLPYRAAEGAPPKRDIVGELVDPNKPAGPRNKIEILGNGQQFVADGIHDTGVPLLWRDGAPWTVAREELPAITEDQVSAFLDACAPLIGPPPANDKPEAIATISLVGTRGAATEPVEFTVDDIRAMLAEIGSQNDYDRWIKVGMAIWVGSHGLLDGYEAWRQWSSRSVKYSDRACRAKWTNFSRNRPRNIGPAMLLRLARQANPDFITPSLAASG